MKCEFFQSEKQVRMMPERSERKVGRKRTSERERERWRYTYIYIYMYMYIYTDTHICIYTHAYYTHVYLYIYMSIFSLCVLLYTHTNVCSPRPKTETTLSGHTRASDRSSCHGFCRGLKRGPHLQPSHKLEPNWLTEAIYLKSYWDL